MPTAEIEGRRVALSNLDKVLYPATGFTKGEAVHYYASLASAVLPHLRDRPVSFLRFPDGVDGDRFFAKHVPPGTPEWVTTAEVQHSGDRSVRHVLLQDLASLVWAANLAALELHTHQWRAATPRQADRIVFDLDPGTGASILDCRTVAVWLRDRLAPDGLIALPKTSGSKGLHLLAALRPTDSARVSAYAKQLAREAEQALPELALHRMTRSLRAGKVFVDHSQNSWSKTTAAPYTLRAQASPTQRTNWSSSQRTCSTDYGSTVICWHRFSTPGRRRPCPESRTPPGQPRPAVGVTASRPGAPATDR